MLRSVYWADSEDPEEAEGQIVLRLKKNPLYVMEG